MISCVRLQFAAWLIPSLVFGNLAVFFIGVFVGPIYPIAIGHTSRLIPREHLTGSIAWVTTCGAVGNVVIPFLTGTLMANFGIEALQPLYVEFVLYTLR
jgi:fucose permease